MSECLSFDQKIIVIITFHYPTNTLLWFISILWQALKFLSRCKSVSLSSRISKTFCIYLKKILKILNLPTRPIGNLGFWTELMRHLPGTINCEWKFEALLLLNHLQDRHTKETHSEWDNPFCITYFDEH